MLGPYYVLNDARRRAAWGYPCRDRATAGRVALDGRYFALSVDAVEAFEAWESVRATFGYELTGNDTGFYNCRHMQHNSSLPMSYHSWGMALDVNWLENPAGSKLVTDIPREMIDALLAIRTNSGARVFRWGGDWDWDGKSSDHSYVDAMHWEVVAHPLDLETGIDWSTAMGLTQHELHELKALVRELDEIGSDMGFVQYVIKDLRKDIITRDELNAALNGATSSDAAVAAVRKLAERAESKADRANGRLDSLKMAL